MNVGRLTFKDPEKGYWRVDSTVAEAIKRLADYENSGLEPLDVADLVRGEVERVEKRLAIKNCDNCFHKAISRARKRCVYPCIECKHRMADHFFPAITLAEAAIIVENKSYWK